MESEDVNKLVFDYVKAEFAKLGSKNTVHVALQHDGKWWVASPKHWNFIAARKAVEQVFGVSPDMTREGGRQAHYFPIEKPETNRRTVFPSH
jgi:Cys-Gly metallodipeptidase DUG1